MFLKSGTLKKMLFSIAEHYLNNIIVIVSWNTFILYLWISQSMNSLENNNMYGYHANVINDSKKLPKWICSEEWIFHPRTDHSRIVFVS